MHSCVHYLHHIVFDPISLFEQARVAFMVFITIGIVAAVLMVAMPEDNDGL